MGSAYYKSDLQSKTLQLGLHVTIDYEISQRKTSHSPACLVGPTLFNN